MGLNLSSPRGERTRASTGICELELPAADVRKLLLNTLPVFVRAGTQRSSLISTQPSLGLEISENPVHEYLIHLGTASCTFVEYLQPEKLDDKAVECFAPQLSQLACFLNGLLSETFIPSRPAEVRAYQASVMKVQKTVK
jgi:hypothetical protein